MDGPGEWYLIKSNKQVSHNAPGRKLPAYENKPIKQLKKKKLNRLSIAIYGPYPKK